MRMLSVFFVIHIAERMLSKCGKFLLQITLQGEEYRIFQKSFVVSWLINKKVTFCIASGWGNRCR